MKKFAVVLGCFGLLTLSGSLAQIAASALNANGWNFVLVPTFESKTDSPKENNLSVTGLNHSLQFAQLLNTLTAGKTGRVRQLYAFTDSGTKNDMKPIESLEPYSVLNNWGVKSLSLNDGDVTVYNSPAYFVQNILANQARGIYIMAMPDSVMQNIVAYLTGSTISKQDPNHYIVLSGKPGAFTVNTYNDHIQPSSHYPNIALPAHGVCPQAPLTFKIKKPAGLKIYPSQSVYFVRHVEAHPTGIFENGNYVCQGQWRALGANDALLKLMKGKKPDYVFTTNTASIIEGAGSAYSYIGPALTVAPFAIQHDLPLTIAPFQWNDEIDLAQSLFNQDAPYFQHRKSGASILVGWEHAHIEKAVQYLIGKLYKNPNAAKKLPDWSFGDYDTVWEISTDKNGDLTFKTTCEGIPTESLPSTCPAFFPDSN